MTPTVWPFTSSLSWVRGFGWKIVVVSMPDCYMLILLCINNTALELYTGLRSIGQTPQELNRKPLLNDIKHNWIQCIFTCVLKVKSECKCTSLTVSNTHKAFNNTVGDIVLLRHEVQVSSLVRCPWSTCLAVTSCGIVYQIHKAQLVRGWAASGSE